MNSAAVRAASLARGAGAPGDVYDLSLADIGALTYRLQPVDAAALVDNAVGAFRDRFAASDMAIDWTLARAAVARRARSRRALRFV